MEKASYLNYQKKIIPYVDGTLSADEKAEFEAFVMTHPEFEAQIKTKQDEIYLLRTLIPTAELSKAAQDSLENEIRTSIFHLLKVEPKNFAERVKATWEEWISR